ncbi:phage terminase large subunit [Lactobacillus delbrueckii subsp. bulgaricus]|nr:phage terminase large subunit [Lactobacillus delbrueckii subsp. bulgaricus]MCD5482448.1 phage terminase large subunit [Lactobacillus delbrueckii subsp. bulgaricus]
MVMLMKVRLTDQINPHFRGLWNTKRPYVIAKGGRGSFKSSVISIKLVFDMVKAITNGHRANVVCIRENASYLRDSVYNQILWALNILKVSDQFRTRASPLKIEHIQSGSTFYFYGANDPMKLKSNNVGNIIAVWFNIRATL